MTVTAEVELIRIDGRTLRFRVMCRDDAGPIGEGVHERVIVDYDRFLARTNAKGPAVPSPHFSPGGHRRISNA
ncbi:MAG: hypothetical protein WB783_01805 [Arenicellales bacterium]